MRIYVLTVSAFALAACGQSAQVDTSAAPGMTDTPPAMTQSAAMTPQAFADRVAASDAFEVQAGELAARTASRADVREFAQMMVRDHRATTTELTNLAPSLGLTPNATLSAEQQRNYAALQGLTGASFDDQYLDQQVAAHEQAVRLFEEFSAGAPDGPLKQWAATTLPKLREHLAHAQRLENAT